MNNWISLQNGKRALKIGAWTFGAIVSIWNGWKIVDGFARPQLVYSEQVVHTPIFLDGVNVNYVVRTITFENIGRRKATDVRVELPVQGIGKEPALKPAQCPADLPPTMLMSKLDGGAIAVKSNLTLTFGWGGAFTGDLEEVKSISQFRNAKREGNSILREEDKETLLAFKPNFHPGQVGVLQVRGLGFVPTTLAMEFESNEVMGKKKGEVGRLDRVFTSPYFNLILGLLMIAAATNPWKGHT